jgi:ribosome-binding protein aMBF1 (putative translation factor)
MPIRDHHCLICGSDGDLHGVVIEGRQILLCEAHRDSADSAASSSATSSPAEALARLGTQPGVDRRRRGDRRQRERRMFPRPEGRRLGAGRRVEDPTS